MELPDNYNNITEKINAYKNALTRIGEKRNLWAQQTKALIYDTLMKLKNLNMLDWDVQKIEAIDNLQVINLLFNKSQSGIIERTENSTVSYIKHGGSLFFAQAYNGDIYVMIVYPFIENHMAPLDNRLLDTTTPDKITEGYVLGKVEEFLDELTRWESSEPPQTHVLGFKN